jgi:hypothetical protein
VYFLKNKSGNYDVEILEMGMRVFPSREGLEIIQVKLVEECRR